jgi:hypothetical protein
MRTPTQPQRIEFAARACCALGNTALFGRLTKVASMCSRKCKGDVILRTYDFARLLRGSGPAIVSGFHSPIERDSLPILPRGSNPIIIVQGRTLMGPANVFPLEMEIHFYMVCNLNK